MKKKIKKRRFYVRKKKLFEETIKFIVHEKKKIKKRRFYVRKKKLFEETIKFFFLKY
jgi:hypothetical protein